MTPEDLSNALAKGNNALIIFMDAVHRWNKPKLTSEDFSKILEHVLKHKSSFQTDVDPEKTSSSVSALKNFVTLYFEDMKASVSRDQVVKDEKISRLVMHLIAHFYPHIPVLKENADILGA